MDAIGVADIESWLDSFDKPGAARKAYAVFRAILRLAFKRGLTDNDVTRREIRLPHLRTTNRKYCPRRKSDAC